MNDATTVEPSLEDRRLWAEREAAMQTNDLCAIYAEKDRGDTYQIQLAEAFALGGLGHGIGL
jgi:hypothetical protein